MPKKLGVEGKTVESELAGLFPLRHLKIDEEIRYRKVKSWLKEHFKRKIEEIAKNHENIKKEFYTDNMGVDRGSCPECDNDRYDCSCLDELSGAMDKLEELYFQLTEEDLK